MQNFFLMIHFNEWGARMYDELQHRHLFIHAIFGLLHECAKNLCEAICVVKKCSLPNYVTWSVRELAEVFFFIFFWEIVEWRSAKDWFRQRCWAVWDDVNLKHIQHCVGVQKWWMNQTRATPATRKWHVAACGARPIWSRFMASN